jgi:hypothetical protein
MPDPYASAAALIDWPSAVSFGRAPGYRLHRAYGTNLVVGTAEVDVWAESGKYPWLPMGTEETLELTSTDAADTAAGTGAQTVLVEGLSAAYESISEIVSLAGLSPAPTIQKYHRCERLTVSAVGVAATAAGTIRATATPSGSIQETIRIDTNISQGARFTVPVNTLAQIVMFEFGIHKLTGGGAPSVIFHAECKFKDSAWLELFREHMDSGVLDTVQFHRPFGPVFPTGADFNIHAQSTAANTDVRASMLAVYGPAAP